MLLILNNQHEQVLKAKTRNASRHQDQNQRRVALEGPQRNIWDSAINQVVGLGAEHGQLSGTDWLGSPEAEKKKSPGDQLNLEDIKGVSQH